MRWLFILLLVLNIGYVAWELNRENPQRRVATAVPGGVEPIVLLSELTREAGGNDALPQPEPADSAANRPVQKPKSAAIVEQAADQSVSDAQLTESVPPAVAENNTAGESVRASVGEQTVQAVIEPHAGPAEDLCFTLGPFSEMKTLRRVTREIKDYVVEASFRAKEEQEQARFRVYIRPLGSKQEAKAVIKQLVSKNIKDYFIIANGPNKNAISLGYFSEKGRAYRYADRVRKLGFDAVAEPVFRSYTIYWLDYRIQAGEEVPRKIFDDHLNGSAQKLARACG